MASSGEKKQVADVSKPDKTIPDTTSRPIIVGHTPMMKDPMVNSASKNETPDVPKVTESQAGLANHGGKTLEPLESEKPTKETPVEPETPDSKEVKSEKSEKPDEPLLKEESPKEASDSQAATSDSTAEVDAVAEQAEATKKKEAAQTEEELKKQEEFAKLIEEKKYFIHTGTPRKKRHARWTLVVVLVLLVGVLGTYAAADAGYIDLGIPLPVNLIQNK